MSYLLRVELSYCGKLLILVRSHCPIIDAIDSYFTRVINSAVLAGTSVFEVAVLFTQAARIDTRGLSLISEFDKINNAYNYLRIPVVPCELKRVS